MAPVRPKTRASLAAESPSTPSSRSPMKKRKQNISVQQKQALIDNLQLEITERARRLRAQYHLQAQGLRSRIEIRVNRIPMALRKMKLEDLIKKYSEQRPIASTRAPTVPAKDIFSRLSPQKPSQKTSQNRPGSRHQRRLSEVSSNKENEDQSNDGPKRKNRVGPGNDGHTRPAVLSPASSNSRVANYQRSTSPTKTNSSRPASPIKTTGSTRTAASNMLSNLVEKAKTTKASGMKKPPAPFSASAGSNGAPTSTAAKGRRTPGPGASRATTSRPGTRTGRRVSANSEASEGSTTGAKKRPASRTAGAGSVRKPVTASTKSADAKKAAAKSASSSTGRVLRKRA